MEINTTFILGILSFLGPIIIGLFQIRKWRAEAKKEDSESISKLVDSALKVGGQEMQIIRTVNADLIERLEKLQIEIETQENKINELEQIIDNQKEIITRLQKEIEEKKCSLAE